MKSLLLFLILASAAFAVEDIRPGVEYAGIVESVSANGVVIDGHHYRVPGGTLIKRGKGKNQVRYQIRPGERVLFVVKANKQGKPGSELSFIEPESSVLDEVE